MFLHFFLLVVSIFFLTSRGENSTSLCSTTYDCGNDVVIKYPFWVNSTNTSSQLCGYPKFGLTCSNKEALFSMPGDTYYVKAINYDNYTIKLVDADLGSLTCPRARHNVTIDTLPLKFSNLSLNLSFYFNCSSSPFTTNVPRIGCLGLGTRQSYVIDLEQDEETGWSEICEDHVVANVMRSEISNDLVSGFGAAMNEGFVLEWDVPRECAACEIVDGGRCGFDQREEMFLCFCEDGRISRGKNGSRCRGHNSAKLKVIIGVSAGVGGALLVCLVGQIVYRRRKKSIFAPMSWMSGSTTTSYASSKSKFDIEEKGGEFKGVHLFSYDELEEATDHFAPDNELGNGGFGTVYKGKLRDKRIVAVKRLFENNYKRVEQFLNEVVILTDLRHPNLVSLYGCTSRHSRELLLVYEYISNGTVADHLHGNRQKNGGLPWPTRMKIAVETATALSYLHTSEIIHRDVKTNNILLDSNFVVKVADFGLSRLFPTDVTHVSTAPQGTPGYVDPEYHECYQLTVKSDVYSFGVVLVELISSLPAVDITRHRHEINLSNMAINKIQNDALHELVDKNLGYESDYEVRKMINSVAELAFQCLQSAKEMRPSMGDVLENLKQIQGHEDNTEKAEDSELQSDHIGLLKNEQTPLSPDTVTTQWSSSSFSTASNTSG